MGRSTFSPLPSGHIPLDLDVFTQDNSDTKKEGVSYTYRGFNGYAPIAAWMGLDGWCLESSSAPAPSMPMRVYPFSGVVRGRVYNIQN